MRKDERGSGGDGLCMIDPVVLGGVINDLATMEAAIAAETKGLKAEFEKVGISAGPVNELTKVATWLHGELPMLRRRHSAAVLLAAQRMELPPGVTMQSVPEDPAEAFKLAGELAAKRVLAGLDGKPPSRHGAVNAAAAVREITSRRGRLSADDLAFLQALYGGTGRALYRVPGLLGDDQAAKAALVDGLLLLSNQKAGGGFDKVPAEIRQDLRDTGWRYWNTPGDKATDPMRGDGFPELARFLLNRDPKSTIPAGDEFATGLGRSAVANLQLQQWLKKEYSSVSPEPAMARTALLNTAEVQQLLGLVGTSHKAAATLMSDKEAVRALVGHDWEDKGAAVAGLTDWAAKVALDPSSPEYALAKRATADLINAVTTNGSASDENAADYQMFKQSLQWVQNSPEIARAFSRLIAANLADFGDAEPSQVPGPGDEKHLRISTDQRHRFAMLASTDQQARVLLKVAAAAYKAQVLSDPTYGKAKSLGFIDAMISAAGHNAVYYEHMNEADAKNKVLAAAQADDAMVKSVAGYLFGQLISGIPGEGLILGAAGKNVVGAGKWVLSRIVNEGIMQGPDAPVPVLPTTVDTDADATGFDVAENQAAHDLAAARLRADPTGKGIAGLAASLTERGADGRLKVKDLSLMPTSGRARLQRWAEQTGGTDYLKTYADTFRSYYGLGEKIKDGPDGLTNYVNAPTR
jgi:hypothetical protein